MYGCYISCVTRKIQRRINIDIDRLLVSYVHVIRKRPLMFASRTAHTCLIPISRLLCVRLNSRLTAEMQRMPSITLQHTRASTRPAHASRQLTAVASSRPGQHVCGENFNFVIGTTAILRYLCLCLCSRLLALSLVSLTVSFRRSFPCRGDIVSAHLSQEKLNTSKYLTKTHACNI